MPILYCKRCRNKYQGQPRQLYCKMPCKNSIKRVQPIHCKCGKEIIWAAEYYCSRECYDENRPKGYPAVEEVKSTARETTKGSYVYGWFDSDGCFYIGRGFGNRAWKEHRGERCQIHRNKIRKVDFYVRILRDQLTEEGATLLECVLIDLIKPHCNVLSGNYKREIPPLTIL